MTAQKNPLNSSSIFDERADSIKKSSAPLAARMRPRTLDEFAGQSEVVGPDSLLRKAIEQDAVFSMVLWGPPGCGKTTLARIIAEHTQSHFETLSAVQAGVADIRRVVDEAKRRLGEQGQRTILFIDEIHRFNKSQQDAILPFAEDGTVTLIGATTENPSFEVNNALLSRARVFVLNALDDAHIAQIIDTTLTDTERGLGAVNISIEPEAKEILVSRANGDARTAINALETAVWYAMSADKKTPRITAEHVQQSIQHRAIRYDKNGEQHHDLISALHKSVRDSDPDAALYWLARMLAGGEDPLYLARRIIRMATEDIGLADPHALPLCIAAQQAVHFLGQPEGELALAEALVYVATAPKSNATYVGFNNARYDAEETRNDPVPLHLRNAPTKLMKEIGYGKDYQYAHDDPNAVVSQTHLPENLEGKKYYNPTTRGFEKTITERLEYWKKIRNQKQQSHNP